VAVPSNSVRRKPTSNLHHHAAFPFIHGTVARRGFSPSGIAGGYHSYEQVRSRESKKVEVLISARAPCGRMPPTANDSRQNQAFHMKETFVISNDRDCFIELTHRDSDPSVWIVRRWTKFMWFKKRISSDWFINRSQAFAYAKEMKREHDRY
jgi:hypothetical protein